MIVHREGARTIPTIAGRATGLRAGAATLALLVVGCGSSGHAAGGSEATSGDAGPAGADGGLMAGSEGGAGSSDASAADSPSSSSADAAPDADQGAPSTTYPAFPVDVAQVDDNGGPVLAAPVVVTITWSTDPGAATYDALGDAIGASAYWKDINSEYGVGAMTSAAADHVSVTTPAPTSYSDVQLDALVEANAGSAWPAATTNTIYALYLPPGTTLTSQGQDLCSLGVGGYHTESQNKNLVYAIMPHCSMFQTAEVELGASHELNEASTDPHPGSNPAYVGFDENHLAFEFFNQFQDELGDACEAFTTAEDSTDFTPYTVQRQWSNKSAAAGSQWCLPKLDEPFYNTTFLPTSDLDTITVDLSSLGPGTGTVQSKGFKVALNASRTFPIGFFSDMATSGAFTIDIQALGASNPIAQDASGNNIANGNATVTLDRTSGVNGDIANVTVTPTSYSSLGITFFYIRAVLTGTKQHHYLPVLLSAK